MTATPAKVMVVGAAGQLGQTLLATRPHQVELKTVTRRELDIADAAAVASAVTSFAPDVIINAAAYTAVDRAETEHALAIAGNVIGPENLARAAVLTSARLIHLSTDFVFDGRQSVPYRPDAPTAPLGVYGHTKRDGELAVQQQLGDRALVVRTAWVYSPYGKNFLLTMLRLMRDRGAVSVVADQVGTPTCTHSLAELLWRSVSRPALSGIYHWTDAGVASWYDFATAIAEDALSAGLLSVLPKVTPIATHEFPTPVQRPAFSVLDKSATLTAFGLPPIHWRVRLREVLAQLVSMTA